MFIILLPVADLRSKFLDARPDLSLIFFIFMQFSEKFTRIIGLFPPLRLLPLWEILDPPLVAVILNKIYAMACQCTLPAKCLLCSYWQTRMHSSRMRTACVLPVSPSMHCPPGGVPARGGFTCQGVSCQGGVPPGRGRTCPWGGCTCEGVYLWGGVPVRGCTCEGVYLPWGCTCPGSVPAQGRYLPRYSPMNRMTDRQVLKHNLRKLRLRAVKIIFLHFKG